MPRGDVEKRKQSRQSDRDDGRGRESSSDGIVDGGVDRPLGVVVVSLLVAVGGLADVVVGGVLTLSPLFPLGLPLLALGGVKLWVAGGLYTLRSRALGLAVLVHAFSAMLALGQLIFALADGFPVGEGLRVVLNVVVIGYLLTVADAFD